MSKKPKPPATLDLTSVMSALGDAKHRIREHADPLRMAIARIEDAERVIQAYAIAVAPVAMTESEEER